jgi:hypothetical protein
MDSLRRHACGRRAVRANHKEDFMYWSENVLVTRQEQAYEESSTDFARFAHFVLQIVKNVVHPAMQILGLDNIRRRLGSCVRLSYLESSWKSAGLEREKRRGAQPEWDRMRLTMI